MSQINIFDLQGKEAGKIKLNESVFNVTKNEKLLHQAAVCQLANARQANAHTKTRGEVRGGGAKPWKQKGTGRARAGSSTSPVWVGGGTVFGPTNVRNYSQMINKKMKRKALLMTLSDKVADKKLIVTEDLDLKEPKTKLLVEILDSLPTAAGTVLIVLPESNINLELAGANLPYVKIIRTASLNLVDILRYDYLLTSKTGLKMIETLFSEGSELADKEIEDKPAVKEEKEPKDTKEDVKEETAKKPADKPAPKTPAKDKESKE